jgi:hypothetical protein
MQKVKRIGRRVTILLWILLWVGTGWGLPCQGQEHQQPAIWGAAASELQPTGMTQNAPHSVQRSPLSPQVTVKEGKLSVALNGAPVREALEAIAYQSGIRAFLMAEGIQATFTDAFDELPLEEGLRRLLRGTSYAFVYTDTSPARRLTQVYVMSGRRTQPDHDESLIPASPPTVPLDVEASTAALAAALAQGQSTLFDTQPSEDTEMPDILPDIPQMSAEVVEELQRLTEELYQHGPERLVHPGR